MFSNSKKVINYLRILSIQAILKAKSGHPGVALGAAPIFYALFYDHLNVDPNQPNFFNRDRFVVSAGHASSLLYSTLIAANFKSIKIEDLEKFRQLNAKTSGHPENFNLPGVDASTGPLGQGIAMAVGLAIAERKLSSVFNLYSDLINHYTYCFHGDGCLQEGIAYEAMSIAGKLNLNKLILLYDSNGIQLDGKVTDSTKINIKKFVKSLGWNYLHVEDGNNFHKISKAISKAKHSLKPTLIEIKTIIGYGSNKANSNKCHGTPFNEEEIKQIKNKLGMNDIKDFFVPSFVKTSFANKICIRGKALTLKFNEKLNELEKIDVKLYNQFIQCFNNKFEIHDDWFKQQNFSDNRNSTRSISGDVLNTILKNNSNILVGSADVSSSTKIGGSHLISFSKENKCWKNIQNINFGVREFAMSSIINGICLHGGLRAIGSTFLAFSDYLKSAIRLAAISKIPSINIFSHDSITVGEDGPTHQPIEQINSLRLIPNHYLFRPYNFTETLESFKFAFNSSQTPITIITSRGDFLQVNSVKSIDISKGAYIFQDNSKYMVTILATGSEVALAISVSKILLSKKIFSRIISIPCLELFNEQPQDYRNKILGKKLVVSIEYGSTRLWENISDIQFGINVFGKSGKANDVIKYFKLDDISISKIILAKLNHKKITK